MDIKICVKCTYVVSYGLDNVPDEIAKKLLKMEKVTESSDLYDWLGDHIRESDADDWSYDIISAKKKGE